MQSLSRYGRVNGRLIREVHFLNAISLALSVRSFFETAYDAIERYPSENDMNSSGGRPLLTIFVFSLSSRLLGSMPCLTSAASIHLFVCRRSIWCSAVFIASYGI